MFPHLAGLTLAPIARALKPFAVPLVCAGALIAAGLYVLDMRADLTAAQLANQSLTEQVSRADAYNVRLANSVESRAAGAELYGRRIASVESTLAQTLERLANEPQTRTCLDSPAARIGLDGMRAQWRAFDAAAGVSGDSAGGTNTGP